MSALAITPEVRDKRSWSHAKRAWLAAGHSREAWAQLSADARVCWRRHVSTTTGGSVAAGGSSTNIGRPKLGRQEGGAVTTPDIRPGDVLEIAREDERAPDLMTVHSVHRYPTGELSLRARYTRNPRGIDWSVFVEADGSGVRVVSRGVARVDPGVRTLLP